MYSLFLDDERNPAGIGWIVARSSCNAICIIKERGLPCYISFDHDLGEKDTAMYLVNWIIEEILEGRLQSFPEYGVHSANPVGAANIRGKIESFKRSQKA